MYALIENGAITRTTGSLRREFPNTSFPKTLPYEHEGWVKVKIEPPAPPSGKQVASENIEIVSGKPERVYTYEDIPDTVLLGHLSAYRYEQENGGVTVGQMTVQTHRESRADLIGARIKAKEDAGYTVQWKTENGFVTLDAASVIAAADAAEAHVQKCFAAEKTVTDNIADYSTPEEIENAFDLAYSS